MKPTATPRLVNQGNAGLGYILLWETKAERLLYLRHAPEVQDRVTFPRICYYRHLRPRGSFPFRSGGWNREQQIEVMQWAQREVLSQEASWYIARLIQKPELFLPERVRYEAAFPGGTL